MNVWLYLHNRKYFLPIFLSQVEEVLVAVCFGIDANVNIMFIHGNINMSGFVPLFLCFCTSLTSSSLGGSKLTPVHIYFENDMHMIIKL